MIENETPNQFNANAAEETGKPSFNANEAAEAMEQDEGADSADQLQGKIKQTWGRLSDDDISLYNDNRDQFYDRLEEKYGLEREDAEDQLKEMEQSCGCGSADKAA